MRQQLEQFYVEKYDTLCKSMSGRVGGLYNAEDVIQEAFSRALLYIDSFDPEKSQMQTWFDNIARRAMYDFRRSETMQGMVKEEMDPEEPVEDFRELGVATMQEVEEEINRRKGNHQAILSLAYLKGYRPREIVEVVDEGIRNVYTVIDRFKTEMREKYNDS